MIGIPILYHSKGRNLVNFLNFFVYQSCKKIIVNGIARYTTEI